MTNPKIELKPCPFCGGQPRFENISKGRSAAYELEFARRYELKCPKCGCTQGQTINVSFDYSPISGIEVDDTEIRAVADAWNRCSDQYTRTGKWEKSSIPGETYNCSICGGVALFYSEKGQEVKSPYCPHCGAKMEVGEKGKEKI